MPIGYPIGTKRLRELPSGNLQFFDDGGYALAAADAEGGKAAFGAAEFHGVEQGYEDARAAGADGVAEGDGAAVDVDFFLDEAEFFADGQELGGEGFVGFDEVDVVEGEAGFGQRLAGGGDGTHAHDGGVYAAGAVADDFGEGFEAEGFGFVGAHDDEGGRR